MMPRAPRARYVLCLVALTACAAGLKGARPDARLAVVCAVPTARVYLDDRFVGVAGALARGLLIRSGARRIEVRAEGYFTAYRELAVAPGSDARLVVPLRVVPDGEPGS
jgi:hypothetical protein